MNNSKLVSLLRALNKNEFREFGRFVHSPFFNRLNHIMKFYEELKIHYPGFTKTTFTAENIFIKIYPGETFSYAKMKNLESDMLKLAEEYLSFIGYKENAYETDKFLVSELRKRKLDKLFEINIKRAGRELDNIKYKDESYFFVKFFFENQYILHVTNNKLYYERDILQKQLDYFIDYFLLQVLRLYSFMTYQQKFLFDFDFKMDFLDEVINYISRNHDKVKPLILLQYYDLMLSVKWEEGYYEKLKDMTEKYWDIIDFNELYNIYASLAKFIRTKFDENSNKYIDEIFGLYKTIISKGIFKSHFYMSNTFFINTVDLALRKRDYSFLDEFTDEYKERLPHEHVSDTLNYCVALRSFYEKDYDKALGLLSEVETQDYSYKLLIKTLTLRIYYETDAVEPVESLIDSFRHFLLNNKMVPEILKSEYLNFLNFFNLLFKIKNHYSNEDASFLKKQINLRTDVSLKHWLIEKIDELI